MAEKVRRKGQFQPGQGGRPVGAKNVVNKTVKETVLTIFNKLQNDPEANLEAWAKSDLTEFYRIASKLIPTEVTAAVEHSGGVSFFLPQNKGDEIPSSDNDLDIPVD